MKRDSEPVTREELHLAWARVPNTAGIGGGFDAALNNKPVRQCLVILALQMRKKNGRKTTQIHS